MWPALAAELIGASDGSETARGLIGNPTDGTLCTWL
ncbi:MAG: hypothetical protein QOI00_1099 [Chloroflexota bacterium]|jgi:hypothetical protein|nr:hypothetical protein [Chloroflexota bacterium]